MDSPAGDGYDVITVGGGLGGLSAAACMARLGRRVLLVERQDGVGGNAHAFRRGPYTFDPAVHVIAHGYNVPFLDLLFEALGIGDRIELIPAETFFSVHICGELYRLPVGTEPAIEALEGYFPGKGAREFIETAAQTTLESMQPPPRVGLKDLESLANTLPMLFKYRTATVADVVDEFVEDPQVAAVCTSQWPYNGLPPSRLSFMAYAQAFMAFCDPGPQYVRGSFQALADGIASAIVDGGGEVLLDTAVTRILVESGRAAGVELDGGELVRAPIVISNSDARATFLDLIGEEHLPDRYVRKLRRMRPSISGFLLYSAARIDPAEFGLDHEVSVFRHWDHERSYEDVLAGRPGGTWLSFPTMHDPGLAPEGEHIVTFTSLMPYDIGEDWGTAKPRITEQMIDWVEELMPGYREAITFVESATPMAFERHTGAQQGAIYGWENDPAQTVPKRLGYQTPIDGLWLAGHWTHPGTGSVRCLLSGVQTAAAIVDQPNALDLIEELSAND